MGYRNTSTDRNQSEIVSDLRKVGATVHSLHRVGGGCPDLVVGYRGMNFLMEVKDGNLSPSDRKLRQSQIDFHDQWRGQCCVVKSSDEALGVLGIGPLATVSLPIKGVVS